MNISVCRGLRCLRPLACVASFLILSACGGSDDDVAAAPPQSTLISGSAAAGAPIIGTVTIKDSSPSPLTRVATIAADGRYQVDVAGLTAPFMLRADGKVGGRNYSLYSAAAAADVGGTINVTPLTDLIVANVAGQIAANVYAAGNFSSFTPAQLDAAAAVLRQRLQPILSAVGVAGSIDLLRASFATDHTGLDAALDALRVTVDPATARATITNLIDNQQIVDDLASRTDTTVLPATSVGPAITEFQQIVAAFDAFSGQFATAMPAASNAALNAALTDDFLLDGQNRAAFLSEVTSQNQVGLRLTVTSLLPGSMLPAQAPTSAVVEVVVTPPGQAAFNLEFTVKKVGGVWRIAGNGRIAAAGVVTFARLQDVFVGNQFRPNTIDSGLTFEIKDDGGVGISYAVVTGKGLPAGGVLYVNYTRGDSFGAASGPYNGESTPKLFSNGHNQIPLSDAVIVSLSDTESYSIELWKDNGTPANLADDVKLATYSSALVKRPYRVADLSVASFATVTAPTKPQLLAFSQNGGSIGVTWTLPAGLASREVHFFRSGSLGGFDSLSVDAAATATTATLSIAAPAAGFGTVQGTGINLFAADAFGRELVTIYNAN
ncbi:MAG: hypothetical protein JWQ76_5539 [Ramlibacter sp.]|nr:hypothetical protein [Ramlibacter sp.]